MKVVLDTNILFSDFRMSRTEFRILFEGSRISNIDIFLPEVVIDEVYNKYREKLLEVEIQKNKVLKEEAKLRGSSNLVNRGLDIDEEIKEFKQYLEDVIQKYELKKLPYPKIEHKYVVARALSRKKPFNQKRAGYRDFLIFESLNELSQIDNEQIIFVTHNTTDFGTPPNLHTDFADIFSEVKQIELFSSLKMFNEKYVLPTLHHVEDFRQKLKDNGIPNFYLEEWIDDNLLNVINGIELYQFLGFADGTIDIIATEIIQIEQINYNDVITLQEDLYLIQISIEASVKFELNTSSEEQINYDSINSSKDYFEAMEWSEIVLIEYGLGLVFNHKIQQVIGSDLQFIVNKNQI